MNCNAEINCWPAETANLAECHEPLINLTEELTINGARTARILYGCRGWVAHHNADLWRTTTPVGGNSLWAIWKMGGAWLCHHLWEHYLFTQDREFLERIYPTMKGAVQFFMDHLVPESHGWYVTSPSSSFENYFSKPFGENAAVCMGPTMDVEILTDLFTNFLQASKLLEIDADFRENAEQMFIAFRHCKSAPVRANYKNGWRIGSPKAPIMDRLLKNGDLSPDHKSLQ